jgi:guanylate kinase
MAGTLFIVSAASGAGKTTLVQALLAQDPQVELSVSYTTRAPRAGEVDGVAYHFVDMDRFDAMREAGEFLEWAQVHGNFYGTSRRRIESSLKDGRDVLLEIDWQGAQQVRRQFAEAVGVFVLPPSLAELERRLRGRGTDSADVIARRLAAARGEMAHLVEFDYVIINNDLQTASAELVTVVRAARLQLAAQRARHPALFAEFLNPNEQD